MIEFVYPGEDEQTIRRVVTEHEAIRLQRESCFKAKGIDLYETELRALQDFESVHWANQVNPIVAVDGRFYKLNDAEGKLCPDEIERQIGHQVWCNNLKSADEASVGNKKASAVEGRF